MKVFYFLNGILISFLVLIMSASSGDVYENVVQNWTKNVSPLILKDYPEDENLQYGKDDVSLNQARLQRTNTFPI